jgi:hypothetical protein
MLCKPTMTSSARRLAAAVGAVLLASCGAELQPARAPGPPLPAYGARDAELFDDAIEPKAIGFDVADSKGGDRLLADRTAESDGVVRARVVTVTSKQEESGRGLLLAMHPLETLAGRRAPASDFTLLVSPRAPAAGVLGSMESRLVGLTFVVFVRGFASPREAGDGEGELHFHLAPDDKAEQDRVRAASLGPLH